MKSTVPLLITGFIFFSCKGKPADIGEKDAWVPVYAAKNEAQQISQSASQAIVNGGKIATFANYVFQVDEGKGIHIIDYSNAAAPVKKSFIKIPQCHELTVKGSYIYTNNLSDLVVLDISNITAVRVTSRIANAFPDLAIQYPPEAGAYFVCADPARGEVIAWELKKVNNPKCKRP